MNKFVTATLSNTLNNDAYLPISRQPLSAARVSNSLEIAGRHDVRPKNLGVNADNFGRHSNF